MATITRTSLEYTVDALANIAGCYTPDSATSAGAALLASIQDSVNEIDLADSTDSGDGSNYADDIHEIADSAPDVYTHQMWLEFVDLGAYREDISEYGEPESLEHAGRMALFQVAERLTQALVVERLELLQRDCDCTDEAFCDEHPEGEGRDI